MQEIVLFSIVGSTYLMVIAKRIPALIRSFRYQSLCLFLATLSVAWEERFLGLYIVAGLIFILKVCAIPHFLFHIVKKTKVNEDLGLFINAQLSLVWALGLTYLSWIFSKAISSTGDEIKVLMPTVAFFVILTGLFLMIFRMTALAQVIGLLVMENGLFLLAATISGGMPFFVEIAIFFDVFVSVMIMGFFVYRINKFFTHIDVNKLSRLRG